MKICALLICFCISKGHANAKFPNVLSERVTLFVIPAYFHLFLLIKIIFSVLVAERWGFIPQRKRFQKGVEILVFLSDYVQSSLGLQIENME